MPITALPPAPARSDAPEVFVAKADAFLSALPVLVSEINALAALLDNFATTSTSVTSLAVGTGSKSLTVDTGKSYQVGMTVKIAVYAGAVVHWMLGDVVSYNSGTGALVVLVTLTQGSGTHAAWTISMASPVDTSVNVSCKINLSGSIANAGDTIATATTEDFDDSAWHDNSTNPSRVTVNATGRYHIHGLITFSTGLTGIFGVSIYKNGVGTNMLVKQSLAAGSGTQSVPFTTTMDLTAGDYIEAACQQNTAGAVSLGTSSTMIVQRVK